MFNYLLVFIGGGLGSICRYGIAHLLSDTKMVFPLATLFANIISCIILGILVGINLKNGIHDNYKFLVMTGFCGGFSTFSTFTSETFHLFQNGHLFHAFFNITGSLLICLICVFIGIKIGS